MVPEAPGGPGGPGGVELLYDAATVRANVADLGARLTEDLGSITSGVGSEPLLLAILGGSLIFLADLVRAIGRPVRYELIQVGYSEGDAVESGEPPEAPEAMERVQNIHYPIPVEIAGRSVVVIKDVVASGIIE